MPGVLRLRTKAVIPSCCTLEADAVRSIPQRQITPMAASGDEIQVGPVITSPSVSGS